MWDIFDYSGKLVSTNRNLVLNEVFMQSSECLNHSYLSLIIYEITVYSTIYHFKCYDILGVINHLLL